MAPFSGPTELSARFEPANQLNPCLVEKIHTYATGHEVSEGEELADRP